MATRFVVGQAGPITLAFLRYLLAVLFLLPVAIFTFLLRNHLLRGMSFGAIRK